MNTFLTDIIPASWRKYIYAILALVSLGYGAWQANDGDWKQTVASLLVTLIGLTAVSNTDVSPEDPDPVDESTVPVESRTYPEDVTGSEAVSGNGATWPSGTQPVGGSVEVPLKREGSTEPSDPTD